MKKSNSVLVLILILSLVLVTVSGCTSSTTGSESSGGVKEFKLGHNVAENNTWHLGAVKFAETVEELSSGTMKITVYPNAQLGDEMDVVRSVQQGTADFTISGGGLQSWSPLAALVECPYTFSSSEHLSKVANGEIGEEIAQNIIEKAGVRPLAYFERGPRKLTANKPIKAPSDMQGLILRVPSSPLYVAAWESIGAKPTPMALQEVFTSLQQGTLHAQENPLAMIDSNKFYEVQDYIMNTDHLISYIYIVMGEKQYQSLTDKEKEIIKEAANVAQEFEHELFLEAEAKLYQKILDTGVEFVDVDYDSFKELAVKGVKSQLTPEQAEIYERIISLN